MEQKITCRVLTGPTASGKSEIALRLAAEEGWDILCMDSMQIYRGMDIGTAKPTKAEQTLVPHHLLDLCDPRETFSVSQYVELAERTVRQLYMEGRQVLFVGGTGLYLEGMMKPMAMGSVPADEKLREELHRLADGPDGRVRLDALLRETDPETADKLPLNDVRRRIRAIEVTRATGIPFSHQEERKIEDSGFNWIAVSLETDRNTLYARINSRVDTMVKAGLTLEIKNLLSEGVPENAQSMQAIGYKEFIPYLRGEISLAQATEQVKTGSRHYAKRQITFLKRLEGIRYVSAGQDSTYETVRNILKSAD